MSKSISTENPPKYFNFGKTKQINYNITSKKVDDVIYFEYNTIIVQNITKANIIQSLIQERYDINAEIALLNNYQESPDIYNQEYKEYQEYRLKCKNIADNILKDTPIIKSNIPPIEIIMPEIYLLKYPTLGNPLFDQLVFDYRDNLISWGCKVFRDNGNIICKMKNDLTIDKMDFLFIKSKEGGDVLNYNPYVKIHEDKIYNKIPEGLPYYDNSGKNTWLNWRDSNHLIEIYKDGYYYFKVNGFDDYILSGDEILLVFNSPDVEIVDKLDFEI